MNLKYIKKLMFRTALDELLDNNDKREYIQLANWRMSDAYSKLMDNINLTKVVADRPQIVFSEYINSFYSQMHYQSCCYELARLLQNGGDIDDGTRYTDLTTGKYWDDHWDITYGSCKDGCDIHGHVVDCAKNFSGIIANYIYDDIDLDKTVITFIKSAINDGIDDAKKMYSLLTEG